MKYMTKTTCLRCGHAWTGLKPEHCTACHQTFGGTTAGDLHRVGQHGVTEGPDRRRCLNAQEMLAKGLVLNDRGLWATAARFGSED
jgi:hypothetical protein